MKKIKYGLKFIKTDEILGLYTLSNEGGDFCFSLCTSEDNEWMVDNKEQAEYVRRNSPPWYNSSYNTPKHSYKTSELAVVEIEINIKEIEVNIPLYEEISKFKANGNARDFEFYMMQKKNNPKITYSYYDLCNFLKKKEK